MCGEKKWKSVNQSCLTLPPMDCSPPGSSVHGILQARILEWVAILFSRGPSQPRDRTGVSCIAGRFFTSWATMNTNVTLFWLLVEILIGILLNLYINLERTGILTTSGLLIYEFSLLPHLFRYLILFSNKLQLPVCKYFAYFIKCDS